MQRRANNDYNCNPVPKHGINVPVHFDVTSGSARTIVLQYTYCSSAPSHFTFFAKIIMKYFFLTLVFAAVAQAVNYATYPSVPKTASINGFSDMIKSKFPACAYDCADFSTSNTPCPYWDTGCLCVMPQWSGQVASCIAESCTGTDVELATSLAYSLCSSVGANLWMMPASISTALETAAEGDAASVATSDGSSVSETSAASYSGSSTKSNSTLSSNNSTSSAGSSSSLNGAWQGAVGGVAMFLAAGMAALF